MSIMRRAAPGKADGLDFVLSDESVGRDGLVIRTGGWDLKNFRSNPIALFGHDSAYPVGRWENLRVEAGKLVGTLRLAARGTSQRIDEIISLIEQDILRAVSVGFSVLDWDKDNRKIVSRSELLEVSVVSVPALPTALAMARSLNISDDVIALAFGEHADGGEAVRRGTTGEHATRNAPTQRHPMNIPLSTQIENLQQELNAARDKLIELNDTDDNDAIREQNARVGSLEETLTIKRESEAKLGGATAAASPAAPAINRSPLGYPQDTVKPLDLMIRRGVVHSIAIWTGRSIDQVLDERYPGHARTAAYTRADQTIATTTVAGWVLELQQTTYSAFVDALRPSSIYPSLRDRGMGISFDQAGTAYIPSLTAGGANGSFFGEGAPMRVGRITTAATTMTTKKMGVIIPFSREAAKRSTPSLEGLVRQAIIDDTAKVIDQTLLDATAVSATRPAGLLNGVAATAVGFGGGDYQAVIEDITALMAPFDAADASDGITLIMNPAQARKLAFMPGPGDGSLGWASGLFSEFNILRSTSVTANRLIAIRNADFITATGDAPEFEMSNTATIHMEDTAPLEIVSAAGVVADPTRSFFQTDTMGVRMVMDINWGMRRTGMVRWIDGTSW